MYCSHQDMVDRFGESEITMLEAGRDNAMREAIDDAGALIDSYLGARYALPLSVVPNQLMSVCRDLVRYSLDMTPDDTVKKRYDDALRYLQALSKGTATLGLPAAQEPSASATSEMVSAPSRWSRGNSQGFI